MNDAAILEMLVVLRAMHPRIAECLRRMIEDAFLEFVIAGEGRR